MLIRIPGPVQRLKAFGCLPVGEGERRSLADVHQTKHILGPAAYAALALELDHAGDPGIGDGEVGWAIEHLTFEVCEILLQRPARQAGNSRLDTILHKLDAGIRGRTLPQDA